LDGDVTDRRFVQRVRAASARCAGSSGSLTGLFPVNVPQMLGFTVEDQPGAICSQSRSGPLTICLT
jgi:hypothetical protein